MSARTGWVSWVIGCMALAAADARAAVPGPAQKDTWIEVRTRNFTVLSTSRADASAFARRLERLGEVLRATHPTLGAVLPPPVRVYALVGGLFQTYGPPGREQAAGVTESTDGGDWILFDAGAAEQNRTLCVQHEYLHSVVHHNLVQVPGWLNEGLAEYYSTFETRGSKAEIGRPVQGRLAALRGRRLIPLAELIGGVAPEPPAGPRSQVFYAESWALVHYLSQTTPERAQRFQRFLARLRLGHPPAAAFNEVAPREQWPALERELEAYCAQSSFQYATYTFDTPFESVPEQARTLPRSEILCRLGEAAERSGDKDLRLAEDHYRLAIAADSLDAEAVALLGNVIDRRGDRVHAESLYTAAGELAPRNARVWLLAAQGAFRRFQRSSELAHNSQSLETSRARFARALQLAPDNLEAMIGFGTTYRNEPSPPRAAASVLLAASARLPARVDVACDLALVLARMDRCAEADSIFRGKVEPLGEESVVESVRRRISRCGQAASNPKAPPLEMGLAVPEAFAAYQSGLRAANQQKYEEAIRHLERADSLAKPGAFRDRIRETHASVRVRYRLTQAIGLINAGEPARARSLLDQIASEPMDDSTRAYVDRLRKRTDTRVALQQGVGSAVRGNLQSAGGVFDSVLASRADDDLKAYARSLGDQVKAHGEMEQGMALLRAGRLEEARARFAAMKQKPLTPAAQSTVENLIRHTDARLAIERALALIRSGDVAEARRLLTGVMEAPVGKNLHAYAEGLLKQLDTGRPR